jgi:UDP-N-acetylmuramate--alanine ligase
VPFYGAVVACVDDPAVVEILPRVVRRVRTYGLDAPNADFSATDIELGPLTARAVVRRPARRTRDRDNTLATIGELSLSVPGRHNLQNALATVAVGMELGLSFERIAAGLREFRGAERRFEVRGEAGGVLIVDDYGHHPTEIAAVLEAARQLKRRVIVAFQPHRFSRTAALLDRFGPALSAADRVILTDIYPAGEDPIEGVTLEALATAVRRTSSTPVDVAPTLDDVVDLLARVSRKGDLVITLGAGSIGTVPDRLIKALGEAGSGPTSGRPRDGGFIAAPAYFGRGMK